MVGELGYPKALLSVEKGLDSMPHLPPGEYPLRRFDLICFCKNIIANHPLYPLLVIECKSVPLKKAFREQVIGYNHYLGAPFIALVNDAVIEFGARRDQGYDFCEGMPRYTELIECLR